MVFPVPPEAKTHLHAQRWAGAKLETWRAPISVNSSPTLGKKPNTSQGVQKSPVIWDEAEKSFRVFFTVSIIRFIR